MRTKLYPIFLHIALIALVALALGLVNQNRQLAAMLAPPVPPQLEIGTVVEPIDVQDLDGEARTLRWGAPDSDRLLFVFTTSCPACKQNQEAWRSLHSTVDPQIEVVGISLDGADRALAYRDTHELPFDVVVVPDREAFTASYEIASVPSTLYIGPDGRVQGVWTGVLSAERQEEVASSIRRRADRG